MDGKEIDSRGLACPLPVMETDKVLRKLKEGTVVTIVDNAAARDNVTRLAKSMGCTVSVEKKGDDYYLTITKG
jgi:tRNA 2-thiouridine synthesizing protein A